MGKKSRNFYENIFFFDQELTPYANRNHSVITVWQLTKSDRFCRKMVIMKTTPFMMYHMAVLVVAI